MFSSNGEEIGDNWLETQKQFAEDTDSKLIIYDCGHYIHYDKHDEIANEIRQFLNGF